MSNSFLNTLVAALAGRLSREGAILCYHSVTTAQWPSAGSVHVTRSTFEETIATLKALGRVVPLRELLERHRAGRSTARMAAITFDDAYAALPEVIGPCLEREAIPITVFVVADASRAGSRFWWDRVDDVYPKVAPARWREFEDACGLPVAFRSGQPREFGPLRPLRQWFLAEYTGVLPPAVEEQLTQLEAEAGYTTCHRAMKFEELAAFTTAPYVEVGVHTVSHPVLPLLSDQAMKAEIVECHRTLLDRFTDVTPVLAAPFGLFDRRTVEVAGECGMEATLTLEGRTLEGSAPAGAIPRFCQMRGQKLWKATLAMAGVKERLRGRPVGPAYPDLPSETT